ncbi:MAG: hypothetical protein E7030_07570 [Akkermansiaceae bacterium]|nr:hypothetical protein [Akkermansiaceae bacterium]
MFKPSIPHSLATVALCLVAGGGVLLATPATINSGADAAAQESEWKEQDVAQAYKAKIIAWVQYCRQRLTLLRGIHDKASADATAASWEKAYIDFLQREEISQVLSPTEEEEATTMAEVCATHGNLDTLEQELDAERARLKEAYYFHSEQLAMAMDGSPTNAYPRVPATPQVAQLFTDFYMKRLVSFIGDNNLSGGPGYTPETAWVITSTPENEKAIECHIIRKTKLNYAECMREAEGFRFNMPDSGRQRMEGDTYLFHLYHVVPDDSLTAYHLKQYFRIEKAVQEKPALESETPIPVKL